MLPAVERFGCSRMSRNITAGTINSGTTPRHSFSSRSSGGTLWGFSLYLVDQGLACDYGVMLDGKTGEILMTNVITGANE